MWSRRLISSCFFVGPAFYTGIDCELLADRIITSSPRNRADSRIILNCSVFEDWFLQKKLANRLIANQQFRANASGANTIDIMKWCKLLLE